VLLREWASRVDMAAAPWLTMSGSSSGRHGHGPRLFLDGQAKNRSYDCQYDAGPPHYCIAACRLIDIAPHPDADKAADLVAKEYDARKRGCVSQAVYLPDQTLGQRDGAQPEYPHPCREDIGDRRCGRNG